MTTENNPENNAADEWLKDYFANLANRQAKGVAGLRDAIPFLARLGITSITMSYEGSGDSGDIEDIFITSKENAPKTCEELDAALKKFPEELNAYKRFCVNELKERVFEILPPGFEINDGSYGEVIINCETGKIHRENNERFTEVRTDEEEW